MWIPFSNQDLSLQPSELHVWSVRKSNHENRLQVYWDVLDNKERDRALTFRFLKDRHCFIIARGILRTLLGAYLKMAPGQVKFQFCKYGKPYINHFSQLRFNISHSGDMILLGFVKKHIIGIDIEYTKREVDVKNIAELFFSEEETTSLFALDEAYQMQAFYNCWTRKEAFIKAVGSGLSFPLDQFVVSLDTTKKATLIETKWDKKEKDKWILNTITPGKDYIGAVSVKGNISNIQSWRYQ